MKLKIVFNKNFQHFVLLLILVGAIFFRLYGLNWDGGHYLHPDERYMYMTINDIKWPTSIGQYLDPQTSPLSIAKKGYIYGTEPLFFTKFIADKVNLGNYGEIHIVARSLSAIFDIGTVILVYLITKNLFAKKSAYFATIFYACMVMSIQQSHFFTVDTFVTFFLVFTFYLLNSFLEKKAILSYVWIFFSGLSFGLALGSKMSSLYFGIIIAGFFIFKFFKELKKLGWIKSIIKGLEYSIIFLLITYIVFRFTNPYFFENASWFDFTLSRGLAGTLDFNLNASKGLILFPPSMQWIDKQDFVFLGRNIFLWGAGIPTCIMFLFGSILVFIDNFKRIKKKMFLKSFKPDILLIIWVLFLYIYTGISFVKSLRYMMPILPFLSIVAGYGLSRLTFPKRKISIVLQALIIVLTVIWPISFIHIYSKPTTRVAASQWIYQNIPKDSVITAEHWDDGIPLSLSQEEYFDSGTNYIDYWPNAINMPVYGDDNPTKLEMLYDTLSKADYIILSSNRARLTIGQLPEKFPYMYNYYKALDEGSLGYEMVYNGTSFPTLFGIEFNDTKAEEAFSVYDHPEVRIYKRINDITQEEFGSIIMNNK